MTAPHIVGPATLPGHIAVDLDGTLVHTDTFVATLMEACRKSPTSFPRILCALLKGRAECKRLASSIAPLDVTVLPYNQPLLQYLAEQRRIGRRIILATGADASIADAVARHLGIFDDVIASEGSVNLTGAEKLREVRARIGQVPLSYAGNSRADVKVWSGAQSSILVGAPACCARQARRAGVLIEKEIRIPDLRVRDLARCLRIHQWSKNLLVFLPLLLSHQVSNLHLAMLTLVAFVAISCLASALYICNDLLDLQSDRLHPRKRDRLVASGALSIGRACLLAASLVVAASGMAALLPSSARLLLAGYAAGVMLYSLWLKRMLFLDVVSLGLFYTVRVLYGGAAGGIPISIWTLACSLFLFTSLAAIKRLTELRRVNSATSRTEEYRSYKEADVIPMASMAGASGYVSVLILALYINSPEVVLLYKNPSALWMLCPLMIYWISRMCLIANRGQLDDDPVAFALKDRATWAIGVICVAIVFFSAR